MHVQYIFMQSYKTSVLLKDAELGQDHYYAEPWSFMPEAMHSCYRAQPTRHWDWNQSSHPSTLRWTRQRTVACSGNTSTRRDTSTRPDYSRDRMPTPDISSTRLLVTDWPATAAYPILATTCKYAQGSFGDRNLLVKMLSSWEYNDNFFTQLLKLTHSTFH